MDKKLRKSYDYLDLPYSSTIEEVDAKKDIMIKVAKSDLNNSNDKQVKRVLNCANLIIDNIKNNGIPNEMDHRFEMSMELIYCLSIALSFVGVLCILSFYMFL